MKESEKAKMFYGSMTRRRMMRVGIVGGAAALAGCSGDGGGSGDGGDTGGDSGGGGDGGDTGGGGDSGGDGGPYSQEVTLSVAAPSIGFPAEDPIGASFMEEYNVDMSFKSVPATPAEMIQLFVAGDGQEQFDVIWDNGGGMEDLLGGRDALSTIDSSNIPTWENLDDPFTESGYLRHTMTYDGDLYGVPSARNADSIAYLEDEIEEPDSWGVVFDDEYQGQTAIIDDYANTPHWTALYLRENDDSEVHNADILSDSQWNAINNIDGDQINNLNEGQITAVVDYLIGQKNMGQFRTIWQSFGNVSNMLQNGEVVASYAYEPSVVALNNQGHNIGYPAMREGNFEWDDHWYLTAGAADRGQEEGYYRLSTWSLTPAYGAKMNDSRGFQTGVPRDMCMSYAEENWESDRVEANRQKFEARQERFDANGETHAWNNPNPDILDTYLEEWNRFLNA